MKQKIILYSMLLFLIVGGIPYFTGRLVENKFNELTKSLADNPDISLENLSYERHWRKGIAKTRVTIKGGLLKKLLEELGEELNTQDSNAHLQKPITLIFEHEVRYGPFVQLYDGNYQNWEFAQAVIYSKLHLSDEARAILEIETGQADFIKLKSEVSIDGEISIKLDGESIKAKDGDIEEVVWDGIHGQWRISQNLRKIEGSLTMPGFHFDVDGAIYRAKDLAFTTQSQHDINNKIWLTNGQLTVERLHISQASMPSIGFDNIKITAIVDNQSENDQMMLNSAMNVKVATIKIEDKEYGPLNYTFKIGNLSPQSFKTMMVLRNEMGVRAQKNLQKFGQWEKQVGQLLSTRPALSLENLILQTDKGHVKGNMHLEIGGQQAKDLRRLDLILGSLSANAHLSIPGPLLREFLQAYFTVAVQAERVNKEVALDANALEAEINQQIDITLSTWIQKNYISLKNEDYIMAMSLNGGQLIFNDNTMPLPKL